ncbi:MAG: hypothetical protein H0V56_14250 [Chthoniobacterales bacterium]|nr:hypothetical protein [Chthoniobacterales bacterium]
MKATSFTLAICAAALVIAAPAANAIGLGQIDDFQNGTTMGWGNPANTTSWVASGGPAGASDSFMRLTATGGGGPGSRLTVQNFSQWIGNYISQGVTAIQVDLRNEGNTDLSIRLAFKQEAQFSSNGYLSQAVLLPVGSGWQTFSFSLAPENMIAIGGPLPYATFFSTGGFEEMRFIHHVGATNLAGDPVVGIIGIDNILAVPEPTTTALLAGAFLALGVRYVRGKRAAADR